MLIKDLQKLMKKRDFVTKIAEPDHPGVEPYWWDFTNDGIYDAKVILTLGMSEESILEYSKRKLGNFCGGKTLEDALEQFKQKHGPFTDKEEEYIKQRIIEAKAWWDSTPPEKRTFKSFLEEERKKREESNENRH